MSSVLQTQGIQQAVAVTLLNAPAAPTPIDIPRPTTTPAQPAYAEGSDHVVAPTFLREEEGGHVVIDLPAVFVAANVFLSKVQIKKLLPTAQKGLQDPSSAFFPSGAPTDTTLVRTLFDDGGANSLPTNADAVRDLLGNLRSGAAVRSFPGITLRAGEFVHIELYNNSGGTLGPAAINAVYKLGLNQADTGKP